MQSSPKTDSLVFASDTTPAEAMKIHKLVDKFASGTLLQAPIGEEWHYLPEFGFSYAELNAGEPVQANLRAILRERETRIALDAKRHRDVRFFIEPLGFILIVLGVVGTGFASEAGKDLYKATKKGAAWLWRRLAEDKGKRELADLFTAIGKTHNPKSGWNPVVLLQVAPIHVTFIIEPALPREAATSAAQMILEPRVDAKDVPLRWSGEGRSWLPVEKEMSEEAWKQLREDIHKRARSGSTCHRSP